MNDLQKYHKFLHKTWEEVHESNWGSNKLGEADKTNSIQSYLCGQHSWVNGHSFKDVRPDRLLFVRGNYLVDREKWRRYKRNKEEKKMLLHWEKEGLMRSKSPCPFYKRVEERHDMRVRGQIKSNISWLFSILSHKHSLSRY